MPPCTEGIQQSADNTPNRNCFPGMTANADPDEHICGGTMSTCMEGPPHHRRFKNRSQPGQPMENWCSSCFPMDCASFPWLGTGALRRRPQSGILVIRVSWLVMPLNPHWGTHSATTLQRKPHTEMAPLKGQQTWRESQHVDSSKERFREWYSEGIKAKWETLGPHRFLEGHKETKGTNCILEESTVLEKLLGWGQWGSHRRAQKGAWAQMVVMGGRI